MRAELRGREPCLEIGVGTGRIALPLARSGVAMVGVDVSLAMLAVLVEKGSGRPPLPAAAADARLLPFPAHTFGSALCCHVLHLFADWRGALAEVARQDGLDLSASALRVSIHAGEPGASIPATIEEKRLPPEGVEGAGGQGPGDGGDEDEGGGQSAEVGAVGQVGAEAGNDERKFPDLGEAHSNARGGLQVVAGQERSDGAAQHFSNHRHKSYHDDRPLVRPQQLRLNQHARGNEKDRAEQQEHEDEAEGNRHFSVVNPKSFPVSRSRSQAWLPTV